MICIKTKTKQSVVNIWNKRRIDTVLVNDQEFY